MTTCTNTTHSPLHSKSTPSPSFYPLSTASKKLQSLKVGVLLLHHVKATFNYNRRRAGLWLVLVWEMRWMCWPYENGVYALQCWQHWHSLHSRWLLAQLTEGTMLEFTTRSWTHSISYSYWSARARCCGLIYYIRNLTKLDETYPTEGKIIEDVEHLTLAETNDLILN